MNVGMNLIRADAGPRGGRDIMMVPAVGKTTRCPCRRTDEHASSPAGGATCRGQCGR